LRPDLNINLRVDGEGRVTTRRLRAGGYVRVRGVGRAIVIEPVESVADKYYGAFKVEKWPKDLDDFMARVLRN
jgi:hypothetical protein